MKRALWALILGLVGLGFAQQPTGPPTSPPQTTPTFPRQVPPEQLPPDQKAPAGQSTVPSDELSTPEVQQQIQDGINAEPTLKDTKVGVKTNDTTVTLSGTVSSNRQHELALRIAQSYAGHRTIVDRIAVASHT